MALYDPQELARMFAENSSKTRVEFVNDFEEGSQKWQRRNLENLMWFLWGLPDDYKKFSMTSWMDYDNTEAAIAARKGPKGLVKNLCGTSACACGHAAVLGIGNPERFNEWTDYSEHAFGLCVWFSDLWAGWWSDCYPTPKHAALRIAYYLKHGGPINLSIMEQIAHKTPETV